MCDCDECRPRGHHHDHHHAHHHDHRGWEHGPDRGPPPDRCECDCDCDCQEDEGEDPTDFGFERKFVSNAEMLEAYEWYLEELLNEAQGVREAIIELKAEMRRIDADEEAMAAEDQPKDEPRDEPKKGRRGRRTKA